MLRKGKYCYEIILNWICHRMWAKKIWLTNENFISKLNFEEAFCIGKGDNPKSQTYKSGNFFKLNKKGGKLPALYTKNDGKPGKITDTLTVTGQMITVPLWLRYGLGNTHKPPWLTKEILITLKLLWWFPDYHGSLGIITDQDGCVCGAMRIMAIC